VHISTHMQAYGAGDLSSLPTLFFRSVLFLWAHAVPLTVGLLALPQLLSLGVSQTPRGRFGLLLRG
jgi:hypothetical protein